ncbi:hypothetical protein HOLleu_25243 [Holothuria leucospilota]|uniref:Uncharacterized protein n=1 Tax=Holothuria leucospilota TaxID=206669 RepID=A0A9Q1H482_HOLLE|nr:hypothetical protein HOLleu_25243 [Holothuria leucospilota]
MYGRVLRTPIDVIVPRVKQETVTDYPTNVEQLEEKIRGTNAQAREHLKMAADRQSFRVNRKASEETYEKGDLVLVHSPAVKKGTTSKLHRPWQGPGLVLKRINDVLFRVTMGPQKKPRRIH